MRLADSNWNIRESKQFIQQVHEPILIELKSSDTNITISSLIRSQYWADNYNYKIILFNPRNLVTQRMGAH